MEIWHSTNFREALLKDLTSKRPWKNNNGGATGRGQLPMDWSTEGDFGWVQYAS